MKKILVLAILAVLFAVMAPMASTVYADCAAVGSVILPAIGPGGSVVITISNVGNEALVVLYWIVKPPVGTQDHITPAGEQVNPGDSWSYTYPADFGGSTDQTGTYTVRLGYDCLGGSGELQMSFEVRSGCFIATAAYGTPMAPQIQVLREFRDQYLLTNPVGEALVDFYYQVSPPMAEFITEHQALKLVVKAALVPAVAMSTVAVKTTLAQKIAIASSVVLVFTLAVIWSRKRAGKAGKNIG